MKRSRLILAAALVPLAVAPVALAHVSVLPTTAVKEQPTEFTVRVPAEEGLTTTQIRVGFPPEITVYAVADAPGWTTKILKRPDGRLGGVIWSGGVIPPNQYADFTVLGTPFGDGTAVWPACHTKQTSATRYVAPLYC